MNGLFGLGGIALAFLLTWIVVTVVTMMTFGAVCVNCPPATDFPFALGGFGLAATGMIFLVWRVSARLWPKANGG